jgi:hypothetical protein
MLDDSEPDERTLVQSRDKEVKEDGVYSKLFDVSLPQASLVPESSSDERHCQLPSPVASSCQEVSSTLLSLRSLGYH